MRANSTNQPLLHDADQISETDQAAADPSVEQTQLPVVSPSEPSETSTPSTLPTPRIYAWEMENGLDKNIQAVGRLLASWELPLYACREGGLLLLEDNRVRHITSAKDLMPLLIDHVRIHVSKNGRYSQEKPADGILNTMLRSRRFLDNFRTVEHVVTTPVVLADYQPSRPGYNAGGLLYVGTPVSPASDLTCINQFLDVMEFQENSDRTNAVAAMLSVPFRYHFPGGKPVVLIMASKSHSGKGTLVECIRGKTEKADINYQDRDWPMERSLRDQLKQKPEIGVINFDNVRVDSSGNGKIIRSALLESFLTTSEVVISSSNQQEPLRTANRFLVLLNTNHGELSVDLLNRSLPIRLCPTGDLSERIARARDRLGCDVKHQWLPANLDRIQAELWCMHSRWLDAGRPLDETIQYPMASWAQNIGGILQVNEFDDFLGNYGTNKTAADPVRNSLGILAYHAAGDFKRARELAKVAMRQGLAPQLLPRTDLANPAAFERRMGVTLGPYIGDTIVAVTPVDEITYRLERSQGRFDEKHPHFRYRFAEVGRVAANEGYCGPIAERDCRDTADSVLARCDGAVQT